mmetsp:Transcript_21478/g.59659  ORF Transcript_21478/g.59659 Transcript_21478/m.59659 type:complete len:230 (+) Transcript_21478:1026-1715(+)
MALSSLGYGRHRLLGAAPGTRPASIGFCAAFRTAGWRCLTSAVRIWSWQCMPRWTTGTRCTLSSPASSWGAAGCCPPPSGECTPGCRQMAGWRMPHPGTQPASTLSGLWMVLAVGGRPACLWHASTSALRRRWRASGRAGEAPPSIGWQSWCRALSGSPGTETGFRMSSWWTGISLPRVQMCQAGMAALDLSKPGLLMAEPLALALRSGKQGQCRTQTRRWPAGGCGGV